MSPAAGETTITILDARLRLVHVPRSRLHSLMSPIIDCWWFRGESEPETDYPTSAYSPPPCRKDPFFALALNGLEVSIFADSDIVERSFAPYMHEEADELEERARAATAEMEARAGESGITLGEDGRPIQRTSPSFLEPETSIKVGQDEWVALEISFHGDGWGAYSDLFVLGLHTAHFELKNLGADVTEKAGQRVRDISSPLADEGISILFLSTYVSDYLLLKADRLNDVTSILEKSGFLFTPPDDDGEEEETVPSPRHHSLSRSSTQSGSRRQNSGSLAGSMVLSDRGSAGGASVASSARGATLSRAGSMKSANGAPSRATPQATARASFGQQDAISPLSPTLSSSTVPLSPPPSMPASPSPATPLPLPFTPGESLTILPDELVCVGLSLAHEESWKAKLVQAIFFPERVMPPTRKQLAKKAPHSSASMTSSFLSTSSASSHASSSYTPAQAPTPTSRTRTSTDQTIINGNGIPSSPRLPLSSLSIPPHPSPRIPYMSPRSFSNRSLAASVSTSQSDYPTPFIALTQTIEGTSLTADLRLLRAVFKESEEAEMVYATGNGGLRGIWAGEEGVEGDDSDRSRSRERREKQEEESSGSDSGGEGDESEDWESLDREELERERREKLELAKRAGEGGRVLLKCICLDLYAYGLDKTGIVEHLAGLLIEQDINLNYTSTFQSANILVAKSDITRARRILEENTQLA
ncbi:hypothetical protein P7C70_g5281, partial [Phenoliferia sp. Uapishka_3]